MENLLQYEKIGENSGAFGSLHQTVFSQLKGRSDESWKLIAYIVLGPVYRSSSGYPFLSRQGFRAILKGLDLLWPLRSDEFKTLLDLESSLSSQKASSKEQPLRESMLASIKVLKNIYYTASICAPPDLWIVRHVASAFNELGLFETMQKAKLFSVESLASLHGLDKSTLQICLSVLYNRGYIESNGPLHFVSDASPLQEIASLPPLDPRYRQDMLKETLDNLNNKNAASNLLEEFYATDNKKLIGSEKSLLPKWIAKGETVESYFRLVPAVLASHRFGYPENDASLPGFLSKFLRDLNLLDKNGFLTPIGKRIFERGPGPFGIIHAYSSYMEILPKLLKGEKSSSWVSRGDNVNASKKANSRTFQKANDNLDRYCHDKGYAIDVFVEHAVGEGEATRQRFTASGEKLIQYYGADLEMEALEKSKKNKERGLLPSNMKFIGDADIGVPEKVTEQLKADGHLGKNIVMMVGNGFHEIRNQSDEKMIDVFKKYREAGILLIFTEESGLHDNIIRDTAWNTYHSGFKFVHEISGQGLRPAQMDSDSSKLSWTEIIKKSGYKIDWEYSHRTRTVFPYPLPGGHNPSISVTYFCCP